ncbi:hypothetical protein U9M48_001859 [Paspalum notatum var. saurae]|uniref:PB1 domain-containing protein n=1 Tax=Paspalum notatum var. saurae TaxID=547442 RepID=A0AAQ3PFC1_PASNO
MAVGSWSSCSSSTSSLGSSFDDVVVVKPPDAAAAEPRKKGEEEEAQQCYGGRILPRHTDGALRYVGGDNRVLSLDRRRLRFHELVRRLSEVCGWEVRQVRCQLPTEDLDALVSVTTDADLASLLDVYDDAAASHGRRLLPLKIRAFLFSPRPTAPPEPPPSSPPPPRSSSTSPSVSSGRTTATASPPNAAAAHLLRRQQSTVAWANASPTYYAPPRWWEQQAAALARADPLQRPPPQHCHRHGGARPAHGGRLVHDGSHWQ